MPAIETAQIEIYENDLKRQAEVVAEVWVARVSRMFTVHQISRSEKQNCYGGGVRQMYVAGRLGLAEQLVS